MLACIEPNWNLLIGLGATVALGFGVGPIVKRVGDAIPIPPPADDAETVKIWKTRVVEQSTGGW